MPDSHIQAWEDELPEHPVVAELREHPGRWAVVSTEAYIATRGHPHLERRSPLSDIKPSPALRWLPDPVVAAMHVLKGGHRG